MTQVGDAWSTQRKSRKDRMDFYPCVALRRPRVAYLRHILNRAYSLILVVCILCNWPLITTCCRINSINCYSLSTLTVSLSARVCVFMDQQVLLEVIETEILFYRKNCELPRYMYVCLWSVFSTSTIQGIMEGIVYQARPLSGACLYIHFVLCAPRKGPAW